MKRSNKKTISRICSCGLTVVMLLGSCTVGTVLSSEDGLFSITANAAAAETPAGSFTYSKYDGSVRITGFIGDETEVVIPETIDGLPVTTLGNYNGIDGVFFNSDIVSVTIPDTVTKIDRYTFYGCDKLKSVRLPSHITEIGMYTFYGCSQLESVSIPDGVTKICSGAFFGCTWLKSVTIPDSVTEIEEFAFCDCKWLDNITLPTGLSQINNNLFSGCSALKEIDIPSGVKTIDIGAFEDCSKLASVTFSEGIETIGYCSFKNCESLKNIVIPKGTVSIEEYAFRSCSDLTSVSFLEDNTNIEPYAFESYNTITFYGNKGSTAEKYARNRFCPFNFSNYSVLSSETIRLGQSVSVICSAKAGTEPYRYAIYIKPWGTKEYTKLRGFTTKTKYTFTPEQAGKYRIKVTAKDAEGNTSNEYLDLKVDDSLINTSVLSADTIELGETVTVSASAEGGKGPYEYAVYYKKASSDKLTVASSFSGTATVAIKPGAAVNYDVIVKIRDTSGKVVRKAFSLTVNQKDVIKGKNEEENYSWEFNKATGKLTIRGKGKIGGTKGLSEHPWDEFIEDIKDIEIRPGATVIGDYLFYGCVNAETITIPEGVTELSCRAFSNVGVKSIRLPASLQKIDTIDFTFDGDKALEAFIVPQENEYFCSVDGVLFSKDMKTLICYPYEKKDTVYHVPEGTEYIMDINGVYLDEIFIPGSVKEIMRYAFAYRSNITTVHFEEGLQCIKECAFMNCKNLKSVTLPSTTLVVMNSAFLYCDSLESITVLSDLCFFEEKTSTLPRQAVVYANETAAVRQYVQICGGTFVDLKTGESTVYRIDNDYLVSLIPDKIGNSEPVECAGYTTIMGEINGYPVNILQTFQPHIAHENDTSREDYQRLLGITNELIKDQPTDFLKAKSIMNWVNDTINYRLWSAGDLTIDYIYDLAFYSKTANCMGYSYLMEYMLYLAGIPNVNITSAEHNFCAAKCNGTWICFDPTNCLYGSPNELYEFNHSMFEIEKITFTSGSKSFLIKDGRGATLVGLDYHGWSSTPDMVVIPSYVSYLLPEPERKLANNVFLNKLTAKMKVGGTMTLTATGNIDDLRWVSKNKNVVTVDNGKVTAVGTGTAKVVVRNSAGKYYYCTITITD